MARRRKAEESEDWVPPPFDEVEFMKKEITAAKASVVSVLYAVGVAAVSYLITLAGLPIVAFFAGFGMIFLLYYLMPLTRVNTANFKRRDWIGHGSIVFFSWLAFWILLLNPPFGDFTRPDIVSVSVASAGSTTALVLSCKNLFPGDNTPLALGGNSTLYITFRATDNVAVASVAATLDGVVVPLISPPGSTNRCRGGTPASGTHEGFMPAGPGLVTLVLRATDTAGIVWTLTFRFTAA